MSEEGGGASRTTDPAAGSSAATDVSLLEFILAVIRGDRQRYNERFMFLGTLGAVIWFFIERHMGQLNYANARLKEQQDGSVSSDTYRANEQQRDKESEELGSWRKEVDRDRTQSISRDEFNRDVKGEKRSSIDTGTKLIAVAVSVVVLLLGILNYQALHHFTTPTPTVTTPREGTTNP